MCGIAGFVSPQDDPAALRRMTDVIAHRGPDDSGCLIDGSVHLGHLRLSIVDLSPLGHQPMANEDGTVHIIFNGEIFNHADLRPELERAGHRYRSRSDTETMIHAWEEYGPACVERFRGMFAFALWDRTRRVLFCARDRLGIKPFYYYFDGAVFVFASEIKALLEHPAVPCALNEDALAEYLSLGFNTGEQTLFRGIHVLLPGHRLELRPGAAPVISRYWDVPQPAAGEPRSDEDWIAECRRRLEETVRMRLMSDVPLGAFLSGGVDSSAITALMTRMVSGRVKTYSVGYREAAYSELGYASQVADALGTEHREVVIGPEDFFGALPSLIWHEDKPICWPSSVSLYFVSKLAAEEVTVVLTGEGSDEIFAGYHRYAHYLTNQRIMRGWGLVPEPARRGVRQFIAGSSLLRADLRRKLQHTVIGRENTVEAVYLDGFYSAFAAEDRERMFSGAAAGDAASGFLRHWNARAGASTLSRLLYADQKTYLVELLMKQDRMSMATSIESRVPLLDHPLVEFAARVPDHLKLRGGTGKYIFKKAVEDLLPPEIVHRTKMGFPTPLRNWTSERLAHGSLRAELTARGGLLREYIDSAALERLLDGHAAGTIDATDRIWRLLTLQIWGELFFGAGRRAKPAEVSARL